MPSQTTIVVRYAETDAQGVAHHSNYLVWFEEGRSEFLRQKGLTYTQIERSGYMVIVAESSVQYRQPAFYEDRLTIETTLERARGRMLEFSYRAVNQEGTLLAVGKTVHVVLGSDRRPARLPAELLEMLT